jgi:uncharacterized repeat protein (TIGR01451 family)
VAEIAPNDVTTSSTGNAFSYDIDVTIGGGDTGVDRVAITVPGTFTVPASPVTDVLVGGVSVGPAGYTDNTVGNTISVDLTAKVTVSDRITVVFDADAPTTQDLIGQDFLSSVDDSGTADAPQATTEGDGDGDAGDANSWRVTTTDAPAGSCPAIDGTASSGTTNTNTMTISHTTSGTDRLMLVGVSINNDNLEEAINPGGITYNGVALTRVGFVDNVDDARVEIWQLTETNGLPTGTHDVVINFTADLLRGAVAGVMTFTGVDQTTPLGTFVSAFASSAGPATVNVPSAVGDLVFDTVSGETVTSLAADPSQAEHWNLVEPTAPAEYGGGSTKDGAAGTTTMSWTLGSNDHWAIGGISIKRSPSCGGSPAVTSAVAEIAPNDVATGSTANAFSYDIDVTIGGGDTGVNRVTITVPGSFGVAALPVTDVQVGGVPVAFTDNTVGNVISVDLGAKVTSSDRITVLFDADAPGAQDLTGVDFLSTVDDSGVATAAQATTEGNGDGDAGDANSWTVTTTDVPTGDVYYSVGTNTADLTNGSPTISITSGTATLSVAQTGNIGVGDEIDYDAGNKIAYIKSVISPTQFLVHTATGGVPGNVSNVTVNAIRRAFNDFVTAEANSGDASHLTTFDLTATGADATLTWVAYNDGAFATGPTVDGYTTDASHFITLTVAGASQVASSVSQRHTGIEGTGAVVNGLDVPGTGIDILDDYTVVEWLELTRLGPASEVVRVDAANVLLTHLIIYNMLDHGIDHTGAGVSFTIRNSLIYGGGSDGISWSSGGGNVTIENCTIYGMGDRGIEENAGTYTVRNTLSMGNAIDFDVSNGTQDNNMSSDATAQPVANQNKLPADQFIDHLGTPPNFHLKGGADAIDAGTDLSVSFTDDIDGDSRPIGAQWDIGVDETSASPAATSAVAEIAPNDVATGSTANAFSYDIDVTIGGGDTGVDRVTITVPGSFGVAALPVTDVQVGGVPVAFTDNTVGNVISVDLGAKVASSDRITVLFDADAPGTQDLTGVDFTSTVDDSGTADPPLPTTEGNGDGDAGDANSWTVTTTDAAGGCLVDVRVSANSDDLEEYVAGGAIDWTSSDLELGDEQGSTGGGAAQLIGMRFAGLAIPQGTTITNAYIQFTVDETDSVATNLTVRGELTGDAATFANAPNSVSSRVPQTAAFVDWNNVPAWTTSGDAGLDQRTPNLAAIIEEIVNQGTWSSGNALVIVVTGTGERTAHAHNGVPASAPLLHVECSSPAVTSALAEIAPNDVATGSTANAFSYDIDVTIGGGDTGVNRVAITVPGSFGVGALPVTDVQVGGVPVAFTDNTVGNVISVDLGAKVTSSDRITVLFDADAPGAQDLTGVDFLSTVDDSGTTNPPQATTEGNGDGDAGDNNSWTVTTTDPAPGACVAVDTASSIDIPSTSPNPVTFSHTTSGSDRLLLVSVASQPNQDDGIIEAVTGVTYGGQPLVFVGAQAQGVDNARIEIWRLVNPPIGPNTVAITFNDAFNDPVNGEGAVAGAVSFTGAHQTTPLGTFVSATNSCPACSELPSVTVSSAANELVFDTVARKFNPVSVDPSQTEQWNRFLAGNVGGGASTEPGAASVTMSWTPANNRWAIGAVPIKPSPSCGGSADLSLTKTADNHTPDIGSNVNFVLTVTNSGPDNATGVEVTDLLPTGYTYVSDTPSVGTYNSGTGVWTVGNLANGASETLTITATANASGNYTNEAEVTAVTETDPDSTPGDSAGDDYASVTTTPLAGGGSCPAPSLIFSDGFESGTIVPAWDGTTTGSAGDSIAASTLQANTGTYSARAETDAIAAHRAYASKNFAGQTTVAARIRIYLEPGFSPTAFTEVMYLYDAGQVLGVEIRDDMSLLVWNAVASEQYPSVVTISTDRRVQDGSLLVQ